MISFLIIVPTLNTHQIITKLISSIKSQTYSNLRVVFVDGNSNIEHVNYLNSVCKNDKRFYFVKQEKNRKGVFGAMNQGFKFAKNNEWIIFLGSDDWFYSDDVLNIIANRINKFKEDRENPDLIFGKARYINYQKEKMGRTSKFQNIFNYKLSLFFGSVPPHQATVFGPTSYEYLNNYSEEISLSADLDYFLKIRNKKKLFVDQIDQNFVFIGQGGLSGRNVLERIKQVLICYFKSFKLLFFIPFFMRYYLRSFDFFRKFFWRIN